MNALRIEADDSAAKVEELQSKVKSLEQENLQKEQEITSLQHKNSVLEQEVEKLEGMHKDAKAMVEESSQHGTQNETLQRRLQLLEEEAEENDKNLRETNEKYDTCDGCVAVVEYRTDMTLPGSAKPTSRPATTSAKSKPSSRPPTRGRRSTRRWPRNTPTRRRSSMTLWQRLVTSEHPSISLWRKKERAMLRSKWCLGC